MFGQRIGKEEKTLFAPDNEGKEDTVSNLLLNHAPLHKEVGAFAHEVDIRQAPSLLQSPLPRCRIEELHLLLPSWRAQERASLTCGQDEVNNERA